MADPEIVARLRLWADGVEQQRAIVLAVAIREAADEIERLRAERDEARRERDEATRLLHAMVEHIYGITPLDKNPKHDCGFDHRPDLGSCKFCEDWTAANVILYGEEYAND